MGDENTHLQPLKSCHLQAPRPATVWVPPNDSHVVCLPPGTPLVGKVMRLAVYHPSVLFIVARVVSVFVCIRVIKFLVNSSRVFVSTLYIVEWLNPMGIVVTVARKVGPSVFETKARDNLLSFWGYVVFICRLCYWSLTVIRLCVLNMPNDLIPCLSDNLWVPETIGVGVSGSLF